MEPKSKEEVNGYSSTGSGTYWGAKMKENKVIYIFIKKKKRVEEIVEPREEVIRRKMVVFDTDRREDEQYSLRGLSLYQHRAKVL